MQTNVSNTIEFRKAFSGDTAKALDHIEGALSGSGFKIKERSAHAVEAVGPPRPTGPFPTALWWGVNHVKVSAADGSLHLSADMSKFNNKSMRDRIFIAIMVLFAIFIGGEAALREASGKASSPKSLLFLFAAYAVVASWYAWHWMPVFERHIKQPFEELLESAVARAR